MRYVISAMIASVIALTGTASAEVPRVVADIPPVHALVAMVMGDLGEPVLLTDRGANAHAFQLRPSQAAEIAAAGLIVWVGPEMTPWLERTLDGLATSASDLRLMAVAGTYLRPFGAETEADHADAHDHETAAAAADAEGHDDHDHAGTDPHAWLDPANAQLWLDAIAAELARLDPENAARYAENATAAKAGIAETDAAVAAILAPVKERGLVVFHDAYGYFAGHYGLTVAGAISLGDASAPGAAHLAELREIAAAGTLSCIFPEANHDPRLAEQLAESVDVPLGGALDPAGAALDPGPGLYAALLTGLATTIADCPAANP